MNDPLCYKNLSLEELIGRIEKGPGHVLCTSTIAVADIQDALAKSYTVDLIQAAKDHPETFFRLLFAAWPVDVALKWYNQYASPLLSEIDELKAEIQRLKNQIYIAVQTLS